MTILDAYNSLKEIVNRNITNDNIAIDKSRFALIFNRAQDIFQDNIFYRKSDDDIRLIQNLLVTESLTKLENKPTYCNFNIPKDFYNFSNVSFYGTKENCNNQRLFTYEIKSMDSEEILSDENNKPSFFAREVPYYLSNNTIKVFKDVDFEITKCDFEYYRKPIRVDIAGYIKPNDGTPSTDIHPEWSDKITNKILNIAAEEFQLNNISSAQTEQYRTIKNNQN